MSAAELREKGNTFFQDPARDVQHADCGGIDTTSNIHQQGNVLSEASWG